MKLFLFVLLTFFVSVLCPAGETTNPDSILSQNNVTPSNGQDDVQYQQSLRQALMDSIRLLHNEMEQLHSVIERTTFGIASYNFTNLRSWLIPSAYSFNDTLAQYFFDVSENDSSFIQQRGDIQIVSTKGDTVDLVAIIFNGSEEEKKGRQLHELLHKKPERNMYRRVLMSGMYGEERLLVDNNFKVANQLDPRLVKNRDFIVSDFTRIDRGNDESDSSMIVSLHVPYRVHIQFDHLWGAEAKLGNEEIGYASWLSGNMGLLATYQRIKFGVQFPFAGARNLGKLAGKVLRPRTMDGTYGALGEFDAGFVGGSFMYGSHRDDADGSFLNPDSIYTLRSLAQIWYSYAFAIGADRTTNLFRFKIGLGFHQVGFDRRNPALVVVENGVTRVLRPAEIESIESTRSFFSPYVSIDFVNQHFIHRFGTSFQYYDEWGTITVWLELVRDQVRLELKGGASLMRERWPWEPSYFFMLSIPITFSL